MKFQTDSKRCGRHIQIVNAKNHTVATANIVVDGRAASEFIGTDRVSKGMSQIVNAYEVTITDISNKSE